MDLINKGFRKLERIKVKPFFPPPGNSLYTFWEITVHDARKEPLLWNRHKIYSDQVFSKKKLNSVGEQRNIDFNRFPTFFAEARLKEKNGDRKLIGGIRMHLPDKEGVLPIIDELEGYTDTKMLAKILSGFKDDGIAYGAGLWIAPKYNYPGLSADLARAYFLLVHMSKVYWHTACVPYYILDAWRSLGWPVSPKISSFNYPDKRYRSFVLIGNKSTWPKPLIKWIKEESIDFKNPKRKIVKPMRLF